MDRKEKKMERVIYSKSRTLLRPLRILHQFHRLLEVGILGLVSIVRGQSPIAFEDGRRGLSIRVYPLFL